MEIKYVLNRIIFETVVGSRAYGIHHEASDYDKAGVMIPGKEYFFGWKRFDQFQGFEDDRTIYDIRKALKLIRDNNPNMMDLLWMPDRCIVAMTPFWERVVEKRDLFLSKRVRYTYSGYAIAQLRRIKTHRKFLLDPPTVEPKRENFGLPEVSIFPTSQLKAVVYAAMRFITEEEKPNFIQELDSIYGDYVIPLLGRFLMDEERNTAMEWLQMGIKGQAKAFLSLGTKYIKDEYIEQAQKEVRYYNACQEWSQYLFWKKHRNKARAKMEEKHGYDCYSDDTEFLTESGWKLYDDIKSSDQLATVFLKDRHQAKMTHRRDLSVEYQKAVDRFEGVYSGTMYRGVAHHTDFLVTPNHRILYRPVEKNTGKRGQVLLEEVSTIPNSFEFLIAPVPRKATFCNKSFFKDLPVTPEQYLRIMGWYLSDGTLNFKRGKPYAIRISQKKGGRLCQSMTKFYNQMHSTIQCGKHSYLRKPNDFCKEAIIEEVLIISDKAIVTRIYQDCERLKKKRIPRWVLGLSKRLMDILLDAMHNGDGTIRKTSKKSRIYYSSLPSLADSVQEVALFCGYETSRYGPYHDEERDFDMYQIHIHKSNARFRQLSRSKNLKKVKVKNQRIVCFTVPNGTLITRRNGHISIHGNSKHAAHLVRLLRTGMEALQYGEVHVDRTGIDAEEIKAIRNGAWTFEQIEEFSTNSDAQLTKLYEESKLQKSPQEERIHELCISVAEDYLYAQDTASN